MRSTVSIATNGSEHKAQRLSLMHKL